MELFDVWSRESDKIVQRIIPSIDRRFEQARMNGDKKGMGDAINQKRECTNRLAKLNRLMEKALKEEGITV